MLLAQCMLGALVASTSMALAVPAQDLYGLTIRTEEHWDPDEGFERDLGMVERFYCRHDGYVGQFNTVARFLTCRRRLSMRCIPEQEEPFDGGMSKRDFVETFVCKRENLKYVLRYCPAWELVLISATATPSAVSGEDRISRARSIIMVTGLGSINETLCQLRATLASAISTTNSGVPVEVDDGADKVHSQNLSCLPLDSENRNPDANGGPVNPNSNHMKCMRSSLSLILLYRPKTDDLLVANP